MTTPPAYIILFECPTSDEVAQHVRVVAALGELGESDLPAQRLRAVCTVGYQLWCRHFCRSDAALKLAGIGDPQHMIRIAWCGRSVGSEVSGSDGSGILRPRPVIS